MPKKKESADISSSVEIISTESTTPNQEAISNLPSIESEEEPTLIIEEKESNPKGFESFENLDK